MAIYNEKGTIISKADMVSGTNRNGETWKRQTIVLEIIDGNYLHKLALDAMNEKVDQLATFNEGDKVEVGFVVGSRDYNGKWYTDVRLARIRREGDRPAPRQATPTTAPAPVQATANDNPNDDLPF